MIRRPPSRRVPRQRHERPLQVEHPSTPRQEGGPPRLRGDSAKQPPKANATANECPSRSRRRSSHSYAARTADLDAPEDLLHYQAPPAVEVRLQGRRSRSRRRRQLLLRGSERAARTSRSSAPEVGEPYRPHSACGASWIPIQMPRLPGPPSRRTQRLPCLRGVGSPPRGGAYPAHQCPRRRPQPCPAPPLRPWGAGRAHRPCSEPQAASPGPRLRSAPRTKTERPSSR
mmetsp:Transcript_52145/g.113008  ORF Transcript_52145/g.113008 Transcript_52145/m.113008 type:complete len:229 (-) Transcript_52145:509-1195(-)